MNTTVRPLHATDPELLQSPPTSRLPPAGFSLSVPPASVRWRGTSRSLAGSETVPEPALIVTSSGTPTPTAVPAPHSPPTANVPGS